MGAGKYNQRFTLEKLSTTSHPDTGEEIPGAAESSASVWGELKTLTSQEQVRVKQAQLNTTHRIKIHYRTDLDTTWRVRWSDPRGNHTANVTGVIETIRRRELELQVVELGQP